MIKKMFTFLCALVLLSGSAYARPTQHDFSDQTPTNSAVRSLLLPGWGQFHNKQKTKGWIISSLVVISLAGAIYYNGQASSKYDDYTNAGVQNGPLYDDYQTQQTQAMTASLVCAGLWIYAVIDAYAYGKPIEQPDLQSNAGLKIACNNGRANVSYTARFKM